MVLFLFGHIRDFYRNHIYNNQKGSKKKEGYAPIRQDYEVGATLPGAAATAMLLLKCGRLSIQVRMNLATLLGYWAVETDRTGCVVHRRCTVRMFFTAAALLQDFYTRRMYYRIHDTFNRPICSAPDSWIEVMERTPVDGQKCVPAATASAR